MRSTRLLGWHQALRIQIILQIPPSITELKQLHLGQTRVGHRNMPQQWCQWHSEWHSQKSQTQSCSSTKCSILRAVSPQRQRICLSLLQAGFGQQGNASHSRSINHTPSAAEDTVSTYVMLNTDQSNQGTCTTCLQGSSTLAGKQAAAPHPCIQSMYMCIVCRSYTVHVHVYHMQVIHSSWLLSHRRCRQHTSYTCIIAAGRAAALILQTTQLPQ
jgi:hypothetical protein